MRLNGAKPASAFSASPQGAVSRWASTQVGPVSLAPAIERHRMVGICRDGDLGQNRRGVSKVDFKFLDQHGEYQADFQTIDIGGGPLLTLLDFPSTSPLDFSRAISSSLSSRSRCFTAVAAPASARSRHSVSLRSRAGIAPHRNHCPECCDAQAASAPGQTGRATT
jgi:hypothetical protein